MRSLKVTLSDLHLLLRAKGFERWPLRIRFFAEDVFKVWQSFEDRVGTSIRKGIDVAFTPSRPIETDHGLEMGPDQANGVASLDLSYHSIKPVLEKSLITFAPDATKYQCTKCAKEIEPSEMLAVVCPRNSCKGAWHLSCLSQELLDQEGCSHALIPTKGSCPACGIEMEWSVLMKDLSLRRRGQKEIARLFKQKPVNRGAYESDSSARLAAVVEALVAKAGAVDSVADDEDSDQTTTTLSNSQQPRNQPGHDFLYLTEDDGYSSNASNAKRRQDPSTYTTCNTPLRTIIEDSDFSADEILE